MTDGTIRFWKDPIWELSQKDGRPRSLRLILRHPATGAVTGSPSQPADTPEEEAASREFLTAWANDLVPQW